MKTRLDYTKICFIADNISLEGYIIDHQVALGEESEIIYTTFVVYYQNRLLKVVKQEEENAIPELDKVLVEYCDIPLLND